MNGGGTGSSGVSQITAGNNVTISPTTGTGNVTISVNAIQGGLYGYCAEGLSTSASARAPAIGSNVNGGHCSCPSGYSLVKTGSYEQYVKAGTGGVNCGFTDCLVAVNTFYSCYKN